MTLPEMAPFFAVGESGSWAKRSPESSNPHSARSARAIRLSFIAVLRVVANPGRVDSHRPGAKGAISKASVSEFATLGIARRDMQHYGLGGARKLGARNRG